MAQHRSGDYVYEKITDWPKMPKGQTMGVVSRVATDSQDRVYVFQRKDPPVVVFDRDGNYLGAWGTGAVKEAHGLKIVNDIAYTTDRPDSVCVSFTLDGRPLMVLGQRGVHSDTGNVKSPWLAERAGGPFNHPTEMMPHPNGDIYVTDGYGTSNVHRFDRTGRDQPCPDRGVPVGIDLELVVEDRRGTRPGEVDVGVVRQVDDRRRTRCRPIVEPHRIVGGEGRPHRDAQLARITFIAVRTHMRELHPCAAGVRTRPRHRPVDAVEPQVAAVNVVGLRVGR